MARRYTTTFMEGWKTAVEYNVTADLADYVENRELTARQRRMLATLLREFQKQHPWRPPHRPTLDDDETTAAEASEAKRAQRAETEAAIGVVHRQEEYRCQQSRRNVPESLTTRLIAEEINKAAERFAVPATRLNEVAVRNKAKNHKAYLLRRKG